MQQALKKINTKKEGQMNKIPAGSIQSTSQFPLELRRLLMPSSKLSTFPSNLLGFFSR